MIVRTPGYSLRAITASDSADEPTLAGKCPDGFVVLTTAGNVVIITDLGLTITIAAVLNVWYPFRVQRFKATGLTAVGTCAGFMNGSA